MKPRDSAFERLPVAATVVDERGRLLRANAEARRLAGRPRAGETCREFWRCRLEPERCPLTRALRGRPVRRAKVSLGRPGGCAIERIKVYRDGLGRRRAVIVTGPAAAYFKRQRELRREADFDALTRVHNRRSFDVLTERALRGERRRSRAAFMMIDIDGLKAVNDLHGHAAGDALIARLGAVLAASARRGDLVGRVGGDEFAVYCPGAARADALAVARRIARGIREDNEAHRGHPRLSAQVGLACATGARRRARLRRSADAALGRLKAALPGRPGARRRPA
jgi:diguanylate cyclase (GGDEF)-like protein